MRRATFWFIFGTVLLDMLALGIIAPVFPKLVIQLEGGNDASAANGLGLVGTVWAAMQFVFAPVLGALSDRVGRRPVILLSCLGLGLDYAIMALAPTLGWLFVGRVLSGITASSFSTSFAYIADVTEPDERAARFGLLGMAFGLGFILGPAVGGLLGGIGLRAPFWAAGALSLVGAASGWSVLPESLPVDRRAGFAWRRPNPVGSLGMLRAREALLGLALVAFLYRVAHDALPSLFVLYGDYRFGWTARAVGFALAGVGIVSMIVQGGLVGAAVKRLGESRALIAGLAFGALAFTLYGLAPTGALFLLGIPIGGLFGLTYPALQGLMTRRVGADEQGRLQGAIASVMGIAGVIAPLLFTQVFAAAIGRFHGLGVPGAPFLLAALLLVTAIVVVRRGVVVSIVALVACFGAASASAQSVAGPPGLTWRPRAPLEGSAVVLQLSAGRDDSITAARGEWAGEPLHFERTTQGWRTLAAVPFGRSDSVTARATVERAGGFTDTVVAWLVPHRRRAPRERLRVAPDLARPPDSLDERIKEEQEMVTAVRHQAHDAPRLWHEPFMRPRPSAVRDRFGVARTFNGVLRSRHMGVDFAGRRGASVRAANRGVVALVSDLYLSGTTVLIDHGAGLVTGYLHLSRTLVAVGDTVTRGQEIGEVGASGRVTGPHLHWLAAYGGITFDPLGLVGLDLNAPWAPLPKRALSAPQDLTAEQDHRRMMDLLGIKALRPGASGNDSAPNHANYDEALANPYPDLPDGLTLKNGTKVTTADQWWKLRRAEIAEDMTREVYGRVPRDVPKVTWTAKVSEPEFVGRTSVIAKQLVGHVDNASYPLISVDIALTVVVPANAPAPVPLLMMFGRSSARDSAKRAQLLDDGWGYALIDPASVQADNGAGLTKGIIGLVNHGQPRRPDDWGALRAWAWGAARGLDYLETDPAVDAKHVGIEGVSRYGKAALVTLAFEPRFAIGLIGSSGKGGATLHRRNWGEAVENLTGGEYYWMAGNYLKYGASDGSVGPKTANDLPVDSHELIAMCAPRLAFISYGTPAQADARC